MNTPRPPLAEIELEAKLHEEARLLLSERSAAYQAGLAALAREHMPGIRRALNKAADIESRIRALVAAHPLIFTKPKTRVLHGTKVGYQKAAGKIGWEGKPEKVVERIRRLFPDRADLLIHTEEKPNKEGLATLSAADLKKLGCTLTEAGDQVVVKPVDGAVDKMIKALLKEASDQAADGADAAEAEEQ